MFRVLVVCRTPRLVLAEPRAILSTGTHLERLWPEGRRALALE